MTKTFTFQAGPRPVFSQIKFKDETEEERVCWHISVDPRIARGSVYSHHKAPKDTIQPIKYRPKPIPVPREERMERYEEEDLGDDHELLPLLIEIQDRPIEEDLATAKETYIERPPTPHFVPDEPGIEVSTQVWPGDLFDFDTSVRPMIKVIVQHTLLRALAEIHEEVEVENVQKHRDRYEVERNVVLAELQRLEAKEQRKFEEDKRRRNQREAAMKAMAERNQQLAQDGFAESFSVDVALHSMEVEDRGGVFYDEVEREVDSTFLPWLGDEIGIALEVKEVLHEINTTAARRAIEIRESRKTAYKECVGDESEVEDSAKKSWLRKSLVEDLGATKIRRARREYRERKEREESEARARAEAEESAAVEEAEERARANDTPQPEPESYSGSYA
jgi:hypothetical protein